MPHDGRLNPTKFPKHVDERKHCCTYCSISSFPPATVSSHSHVASRLCKHGGAPRSQFFDRSTVACECRNCSRDSDLCQAPSARSFADASTRNCSSGCLPCRELWQVFCKSVHVPENKNCSGDSCLCQAPLQVPETGTVVASSTCAKPSEFGPRPLIL